MQPDRFKIFNLCIRVFRTVGIFVFFLSVTKLFSYFLSYTKTFRVSFQSGEIFIHYINKNPPIKIFIHQFCLH